MKQEKRIEKCEACGFSTTILDYGTGKFAEMMVCKKCESENFAEQLIAVEEQRKEDDMSNKFKPLHGLSPEQTALYVEGLGRLSALGLEDVPSSGRILELAKDDGLRMAVLDAYGEWLMNGTEPAMKKLRTAVAVM